MQLAEANYDNSKTNCCAPLDVALWDERELKWRNKPFVRDRVRSFFHIPLNFGTVVTRVHSAIEAACAYPSEPLWLSEETSLWGSELLVAVDREVPKQRIEKLSGRFLAKVFEGPYYRFSRWRKEMSEDLAKRGLRVSRLFAFYATCPACSKKLGRNQVVLIANVGDSGARLS